MLTQTIRRILGLRAFLLELQIACLLSGERRAHPPLPAGAGWDLGVRVGRTGGHRKSATGRGWMMRLDRSRVRVGLSALRSRRWGKSAGMASLDAGKVKVQRAKFKGKAGAPRWPLLHRCQERHHPARLLSYPWAICMSGFASRDLLSCFQMMLLLHGLQILGLSLDVEAPADQSPIQLGTLSPVASHDLFA